MEEANRALSTVPVHLDWRPRTNKMQDEVQEIRADINKRKTALDILQETFSKKPVNEELTKKRIYRFFPDVVLERLMSADLEHCQTIGSQYHLARLLNHYYYHGRWLGVGPIKEEGLGNKLSGFFATFKWGPRQAPNNPVLEARPDKVLKNEIEEATELALKEVKLK